MPLGISRQRVYKILAEFNIGGAEAIAPKSRAPHTRPHAVLADLRKHIIDMRIQLTKAGFDAGPDSIAFHLERQGLRVPSTSTIRRIITNAGLVAPQRRKKLRSSYIRFEAAMVNECWQADITHLFLSDGTRVEVLDFLDDHSRYLLGVTAKAAFTGVAVAAELQRLVETYSPPASTLTDNGLVFTARMAGRKGGRNTFEKVLTDHRIQQKTAAQAIHKPKVKSNDSTKRSKDGSRPDHQPKQLTSCRNNSTNSPTTITPSARTAASDATHRNGLHPRPECRTKSHPRRRMAHTKRHRRTQRRSQYPLRRPPVSPWNRPSLRRRKNPHGHHRQPHHPKKPAKSSPSTTSTHPATRRHQTHILSLNPRPTPAIRNKTGAPKK
ncbi:Integrase core domain-containing protein [Corynebacterium timonense]|uniref:Integrase core domain-containing protein n=1 Tax=Corynebacterium timonense TaxID=441500 RepID=A0A1H1R251_9CORY|nr:Integrase core domain-containing protein [Corynebacterium timonense]